MWIKCIEAEPGEIIDHACTEACRIAGILGITVWFDFNDVHMHANPGDDPGEMVRGYDLALKRGSEWMERA